MSDARSNPWHGEAIGYPSPGRLRRHRDGLMHQLALAVDVVAPAPAIGPASHAVSDAQVERELTSAEVRRLYDQLGATAAAGFVTALCLWLFFYLHSGSGWVLIWALAVHATQAARLALLVAFRHAGIGPAGAGTWQRRYRIALFLTAAAWGLAPVLFLPADDLAYAAVMMLVLLGMAVGGVAAIATDRASVFLWLLPLVLPLPLVLLWHGGAAYLGLALLSITFAAVNLRLVLAQNHLLSTTLRAQFENAALVRRLHQQMELTAQASREKSQFLAAASHDLRQPLHALSFFGATLERRMAGSIDQPLIYNMMRSIEALDKSFGAILDISKLDAGAVEPHLQSFPIRDLFRRLQMSFAGQAEEAGLQLRLRPAGKVVTSDPQLLERILANLVQNGLRYSRPGRGVLVVARRRRGGVSLEVWDAGIGIGESELPKIFAEFYQVANPERDRDKGLGMGD